MEYYNGNIQIDKEVIKDVFAEFKEGTKMLVFGLGYDSRMWYEGNNRNTFFIEHNDEYIHLNQKDIPAEKIVKYVYKTNCATSYTLKNDDLKEFIIPEQIMKEAPFDIIIIDGPEGYSPQTPGRLIPCYWSTFLSKPGTIIYVDDANRQLENFCIETYFKNYSKKEFQQRDKCTKIYI